MKKNGFIATSLLYAFFLVFISLFIVLLLNFLHNRLLIQRIDDNAKQMLKEINNKKVNELNVGDYVQFMNNDPTNKSNAFDSNGKWIVSSINGNVVTLLSDLNVAKQSIYYTIRLGSLQIATYNPMTIELFNNMNGTYGNPNGTPDDIDKDVSLRNSSIPGSLALKSEKYDSMRIDLVDSQYLREIKNSDLDNGIKRAIFNVKDTYIVRSNTPDGGYDTTHVYSNGEEPAYYKYQAYGKPNYKNEYISNPGILSNDCGVDGFNLSTGDVTYNGNNTFGYAAVTEDSIMGNDGIMKHNNYVDYCYYAKPGASTDLVTTKNDASVKLRFKMTLSVRDNAYIAGGKGIVNDPYIINKGDKES